MSVPTGLNRSSVGSPAMLTVKHLPELMLEGPPCCLLHPGHALLPVPCLGTN